jgi:hypothetical protein
MNKMNNQHIFTFLKKLGLLTLPLVAIVIIYLLADPFKVIRDYPSFYKSGYPNYITLNRDYISTTTFDKYYSKNNYNSFILGNSRSIFYEVKDWKTHLNRVVASCFHFDASGENLYGIYKKVKYLDGKVSNIDNVLLILDYTTLSGTEPKKGHLVIISPQLENGKNIFEFHLEFLKAFFNPKFLFAFIDFNLFGKIRNYMKYASLFSETPIFYELISNEERLQYFESMIDKDENLYYGQKKLIFYQRSGKVEYSPPCIRDKQKMYLEKIKNIFDKHKTNYKIIINPLYDQIGLNQDDVKSLCGIFGTENVFDFSGINEFTSNYRNYYEASHYRPHVARKIMEEIYKNSYNGSEETYK